MVVTIRLHEVRNF